MGLDSVANFILIDEEEDEEDMDDDEGIYDDYPGKLITFEYDDSS